MTNALLHRIVSKKAKALYVIAFGKDLTKLDVKQRASLSMSTVLSSVDALAAEGLVTVGQVAVKGGGKPHSVINLAPDLCVYGVSYKSGSLYAAALTLGGDLVAERSMPVAEGASPAQAVCTLANRLREQAPKPLAVAVAVNCAERDQVGAALKESLGAEVTFTSNTAALAYRALWQGAPFPLVVLGLGNRIKCACLDNASCRTSDLTDLPLLPAFSRESGCGSVLSAARVRETLQSKNFFDYYAFARGKALPCRDLGEYSTLLVRSVAALAKTAEVFCDPKEIRLFGEYLTPPLFDRVLASYEGNAPLVRERAEGAEFARAAATVALVERFFV